MGKATPARPWTASTTPSALSAAPVVSAAPRPGPGPRPRALPTHIQSQVPREAGAELVPLHLLSEQLSPPCVWMSTTAPPSLLLPFSVSTWFSHPILGLLSGISLPSVQPLSFPLFLPLLPPYVPSLDSHLSLVGFGLGQPSCLGQQ